MSRECVGDVIGCILAGGKSSRMGGLDKAFAELGGKPLVAHALDRLAPQVRSIAVNSNGDPAAYAGFGVPVVADIVSGFAGPLAGIHAAMLHACSFAGATHVVTTAADTPFLPPDLVARLVEAAASPEMIVLAASAGRLHPVVGLWPVALAEELGLWLLSASTLSVRAWAEGRETATVAFPVEGKLDPFFNINTPEDLATAARALATP